MAQIFENLRRRMDSGKVLGWTAAIYVISQVSIAALLYPLDMGEFMEMQSTFSADVMAAILAHWQAEGLTQNFINHFYLDFLHPFLYGALLVSLMAGVFNRASLQSRWNIMFLAPVSAALMDLVENILHVSFVIDGGNITQTTALLAGLSSVIKWFLVVFSIIVIAAVFLSGKGVRRGEE